VQKIYDDIRQLGGEVLVVSFTPPPRVASYLAKYPKPFPVVSDPSLTAYHGFGLESASLLKMLRPDILTRFAVLLVRGWLPTAPAKGDDVRQLGGDFVLDAAGCLRYAHPSAHPTDRPTAAELLGAVRHAVHNE
jgi:hypothetical protein